MNDRPTGSTNEQRTVRPVRAVRGPGPAGARGAGGRGEAAGQKQPPCEATVKSVAPKGATPEVIVTPYGQWTLEAKYQPVDVRVTLQEHKGFLFGYQDVGPPVSLTLWTDANTGLRWWGLVPNVTAPNGVTTTTWTRADLKKFQIKAVLRAIDKTEKVKPGKMPTVHEVVGGNKKVTP